MLALTDFTDYMVVVNRSLAAYSPDCPVQIQKANDRVIDLMKTDNGRKFLEKSFRYFEKLNSCYMIFKWFKGTVYIARVIKQTINP